MEGAARRARIPAAGLIRSGAATARDRAQQRTLVNDEDDDQTRAERRRAAIVRRWLYFAFAFGGVAWMVLEYSDLPWYFSDEWAFIARTLPGRVGIGGAFENWNGHLHLVTYVTYSLQQRVFDLSNAYLVYGVFAASLVAIQLTAAAVMQRLGVPIVLALAAGTLVAFFPAGAENVVAQFQLGPNLAVAGMLGALLVVLSGSGSQRRAVAVALCTLGAFIADSGMATFGVVAVAIVAFALWYWRFALTSVAPVAIAVVAWSALSGSGELERLQTPVGEMPAWVMHLFAMTGAGLAGATDSSPVWTGEQLGDWAPQETIGVVVLVAAFTIVAVGFVRRAYSRPVIATLLGVMTSALIFAVLIARTRAVFLGSPYALAGNRYLQTLATLLVVALLPPIVATARSLIASRRNRALAAGITVVAIAAVLAVSAPQLDRTRQFHTGWANGIRQTVGEEVWLIRHGCPRGTRLHPDAAPDEKRWLAELRVDVIRRLDSAGKLPSDISRRASRDTTIKVCGRPSA